MVSSLPKAAKANCNQNHVLWWGIDSCPISRFFSRKTKCCDRFVFLYICLSGWWCGKRLIYWISILYLDTPYNPQTKGAFCLLFLLHIFLRNLFGRNITSFNIVHLHSFFINTSGHIQQSKNTTKEGKSFPFKKN